MAREIENYGDLKDAVADWLERADLVNRIPTFIYLAERKIFRRYRGPNNERTIIYQMRSNPSLDYTGSGSSSPEMALQNYLDMPTNYLETYTLQADGVPLERRTVTEMQRVAAQTPMYGTPKYFYRDRRKVLLYPEPDGDVDIRWTIYWDMSGIMVNDEDDTDLLRTAPDLYLYGALLQAQPFLQPEQADQALIGIWQSFYDTAFEEIEFQKEADEHSGSVVQIQGAY